jgi:hypothetical protein
MYLNFQIVPPGINLMAQIFAIMLVGRPNHALAAGTTVPSVEDELSSERGYLAMSGGVS